jgi:hypothetical protein
MKELFKVHKSQTSDLCHKFDTVRFSAETSFYSLQPLQDNQCRQRIGKLVADFHGSRNPEYALFAVLLYLDGNQSA